MSHTSVILRCPDALYISFEDDLVPGCTVAEAMLAVLNTWQKMSPAGRENELQHMVWLNKRLAELVPLPSEPQPPPVPSRAVPVMPKGIGAKYRKKNQRRRFARR